MLVVVGITGRNLLPDCVLAVGRLLGGGLPLGIGRSDWQQDLAKLLAAASEGPLEVRRTASVEHCDKNPSVQKCSLMIRSVSEQKKSQDDVQIVTRDGSENGGRSRTSTIRGICEETCFATAVPVPEGHDVDETGRVVPSSSGHSEAVPVAEAVPQQKIEYEMRSLGKEGSNFLKASAKANADDIDGEHQHRKNEKQLKAQPLMREAQKAPDLEPVEIPARWESLSQSLEDWYTSSCAKYHAFVLSYGGRMYIPESSPMTKLNVHKEPGEGAKEWTLTCLKCELNIATRRWKQYRTYPCKRVVEGKARACKKRERSEENAIQANWDELSRATVMMEEISREAGKPLNSRQRQIVQRWIDVGNGVLRREDALSGWC